MTSVWVQLTNPHPVAHAHKFYSTGADAGAKAGLVEELIAALGLDSCRNTIAGNELVQGCSGAVSKFKLVFIETC